jgi:glycosyltransferase involved in cell wall biosynthesis
MSPEPIRILDLIGVDGPGGGADAIVLRTAAQAHAYRFRTTVCCLHSNKDAAYDLDCRAAALGIDFCDIAERSRLDRRVLPTLREIVRDRGITIVHAHGYKAAFYARRLARLAAVIPMSTSHGWTGHHWRERFAYYPLDKMVIRTFPLAIAVSSQIRNELIRWGCHPERVHVVLNGIDPTEFRRHPDVTEQVRNSFGAHPGDIVLGAVGRLEPQKRFDLLLEAVARLLPSRPSLRLFVAGDGSLRQSLDLQIQRLGLASCCRFLGHCNDIKRLYQGFDVLVQSSDYEGTPTVVVEAMSLEVPVVATDAGGTHELIDDGVHGLIVPLRDPAALARAIERTLDDREATTKRVAAARRRIEDYLSFDVRMQKLEQIYCELASGRNGYVKGSVD